jgi:hypothetical protein
LDDDNEYQPTNHLTHKGAPLDQVKHLNDMRFGDNEMEDGDSANFDNLQGEVNFHGFD